MTRTDPIPTLRAWWRTWWRPLVWFWLKVGGAVFFACLAVLAASAVWKNI